MTTSAAGDTRPPRADALVLHEGDSVATALRPLNAGETVCVRGAGPERNVALLQAIALCHKFALDDIARGATVLKYGESIGRASCAIAKGEHVHIQNVVSARGIAGRS